MSRDHPRPIGALHSLYATPLHRCYTSPNYKYFHTIICNRCCFLIICSATTATCSSARLLGIPAPTASGIDHVLLASYANFTFIITSLSCCCFNGQLHSFCNYCHCFQILDTQDPIYL